jgi:DNA-binding MarR family transcriptional regulator
MAASSRDLPEQSVDLGQSLAALLRRFYLHAGVVLEELPGGPRGFQVLSLATAQDSIQAEIAQRLGLDRTVMTRLVDELEEAGLVERKAVPADRRARLVVITPSGRDRLRHVSAEIARVERGVLSGLDDEEAALLHGLLAKANATPPG